MLFIYFLPTTLYSVTRRETAFKIPTGPLRFENTNEMERKRLFFGELENVFTGSGSGSGWKAITSGETFNINNL